MKYKLGDEIEVIVGDGKGGTKIVKCEIIETDPSDDEYPYLVDFNGCFWISEYEIND